MLKRIVEGLGAVCVRDEIAHLLVESKRWADLLIEPPAKILTAPLTHRYDCVRSQTRTQLTTGRRAFDLGFMELLAL